MAFYRPAAWQKPLSVVILCAALALPTFLQAFGQEFYIGFATRVLIFALAASSLNLILGFGGMVSLGHAAFLGAGAYVAAICQQAGINEALIAFPAAMAPGVATRIVGIRPGEKLHEVMCPADDSHLTMQFADHYVIGPTIRFWGGAIDYRKNALGETGEPVAQGFEYNSGTNRHFLSTREIAEFNRAAGAA